MVATVLRSIVATVTMQFYIVMNDFFLLSLGLTHQHREHINFECLKRGKMVLDP